jgi:hypothetical protein
MPDNITIKDSSNAEVPVATEDIGGGVEVQRVKLMLGAHGQDGGDVTCSNPLPVEIQNTTDMDSPVWGNPAHRVGQHVEHGVRHAADGRHVSAVRSRSEVGRIDEQTGVQALADALLVGILHHDSTDGKRRGGTLLVRHRRTKRRDARLVERGKGICRHWVTPSSRTPAKRRPDRARHQRARRASV